MELTPLQQQARAWMRTTSWGLLPLPVGEGKTAAALHYLDDMDEPALIISTKNIIEMTWATEIEDWGFDFSYGSCTGSLAKREEAVRRMPFLLGVSFDHLDWYYRQANDPAARRICIIDETSKLKTPPSQSKRVKAQQKFVGQFDKVFGLSATPAPEGAIGLHPQFGCLTRERPWGTLTDFRSAFFERDQFTPHAAYELREGALAGISAGIKGHFFPAPEREIARFGLPAPRHYAIPVPWKTKKAKAQYEQMKKECLVEFGGSEEEFVEAANAGVLQNKLRQLASGFIYDNDDVYRLPSASDKVDAVAGLIDRLADRPLLVFTQFEEENIELLKRFPHAMLGLQDKAAWNAGRVPLLILHPKSAGHGLNIQHGSCEMLFYAMPWSAEDFDQCVGRLYRRGQRYPVSIGRLVRDDSIELRIFKRILEKRETEYEIVEYLSGRRAA